MKRVLLFLLLSFAMNMGHAQTDTAKSAPAGQIEVTKPTFFKSGKFTVNGQQETFKEISTRLANAQASAYEFNEYKKYNNLTGYMALAGIACLISSVPLNHGLDGWKTTQGKVAFGLGYGFLIPESIFAFKRHKHFWKAVSLYNQQH